MTSVYGYPHNYAGDNIHRRHQHSASFYGPGPMPQAYHHDVYVPQAHQFPYHAGYQAPPPMPAYYAPPQPVQELQQQPVTGGVTSVLDYDLDTMSKFITYLGFRLFGRADTDNARFIGSVKSVLSAVRLPLSSLILSAYYLLQKYEKEPKSFTNNIDDNIFQVVVVSLVLANKANDDNTFTNRSWSDATGLNIRIINSLEASWLALLSWRLHDTDNSRYNELQTQYTKYAQNLEDHQQKVQQHQHQQQVSMAAQQQYNREPISPILSDRSEFSPRYDAGQFQPQGWSYEFQSAGFEPHPHHPMRYGHQKSYSLQLEPEYCARTGSYQKNMYCLCRFCSSPSRPVDWTYSTAVC